MIKTGIIFITNIKIFKIVIKNVFSRAQSAIAKRLATCVSNVKNVTIWGNHSSTQFPDVYNASVLQSSGKSVSVYESINDTQWLEGEFIKVRHFIDLIIFIVFLPLQLIF